ncbi:nicotinamide riboside transporter PnuC [Microbulbifer thermotolerans]|uniref:Nicotinamide riboside transporter PnuC n=1 Tax=Microbulbifer thermotolerans TaxID=252514 RepID=A0A143HQ64_MICTH|nr:nicotinamide riboside transporter PnuC [Microbulbifer thermotolerans]AMX03828.1 nicotinamide mononucleotide transporter [Microbulbifer thermotolerans]MCX2778675.1 nicotinamide riboside transporter PnuC [Microbulbifer thermotolerans]MCX2783775.1 nicotinamide riboside transporter PnuC [Microbulbifer thermotolerans]MCX2794145.1 nicotinamide riboside transporter PnuC [Microbulbifer thermotolerans]MCX2801636.1 nicotinamide riboside transporter PnuC [Microbulbifer thermotolerans]
MFEGIFSSEVGSAMTAALKAMSAWEIAAVILALAYLLLAMKEKISCWYAAFASTTIYLFLFWDVSLMMESALQIFYLLMAVYGWWQWRHHRDQQRNLKIHCWPFATHLAVLAGVGLLTLVFGYLLDTNTNAALPYLDSFTTWGAVITTYMVTRKVLENWLYWIVVDGVSIYLYIDRGLYLTALLFALYVIIVIVGFFQWLAIYKRESRGADVPTEISANGQPAIAAAKQPG